MKLVSVSLFSFLLTYTIIPIVILLAKRYNCVDVPGGRRLHTTITPTWGGGAFLLGVLLPLLFFIPPKAVFVSFATASIILVVIGLVDDYRPLGWKAKFAGIAVASTIVIFGAHAVVNHIGSNGNIGQIQLGWLSIPFTYFCILGVTNALNLFDGLNGLAGGAALLGFLFLGIAGLNSSNTMVVVTAFSFVGALAAFLPYNFPDARLFMGDSGSLFLGFSLAALSIFLTQEPASSVSPMYPVLVLLVPIFDTLRLLAIRLMNRKNPFHGDKGHLHHLFVRRGIPASRTTVILWTISAICGISALALVKKPSSTVLCAVCYGIVGLSILVIVLASRRRNRSVVNGKAALLMKRSRIINLLTKLWLW